MSGLESLLHDLRKQTESPDTPPWMRIILKTNFVVCQQLQLANMQIQQNSDELKRENIRLGVAKRECEELLHMKEKFESYGDKYETAVKELAFETTHSANKSMDDDWRMTSSYEQPTSSSSYIVPSSPAFSSASASSFSDSWKNPSSQSSYKDDWRATSATGSDDDFGRVGTTCDSRMNMTSSCSDEWSAKTSSSSFDGEWKRHEESSKDWTSTMISTATDFESEMTAARNIDESLTSTPLSIERYMGPSTTAAVETYQGSVESTESSTFQSSTSSTSVTSSAVELSSKSYTSIDHQDDRKRTGTEESEGRKGTNLSTEQWTSPREGNSEGVGGAGQDRGGGRNSRSSCAGDSTADFEWECNQITATGDLEEEIERKVDAERDVRKEWKVQGKCVEGRAMKVASEQKDQSTTAVSIKMTTKHRHEEEMTVDRRSPSVERKLSTDEDRRSSYGDASSCDEGRDTLLEELKTALHDTSLARNNCSKSSISSMSSVSSLENGERKSSAEIRVSSLSGRRSSEDERKSSAGERRASIEALKSSIDKRRSSIEALRSSLEDSRNTPPRRSSIEHRKSLTEILNSTDLLPTKESPKTTDNESNPGTIASSETSQTLALDKEEDEKVTYMSDVTAQYSGDSTPPRRISVSQANEEWNILSDGGRRERRISFAQELGDTTTTETATSDSDDTVVGTP